MNEWEINLPSKLTLNSFYGYIIIFISGLYIINIIANL